MSLEWASQLISHWIYLCCFNVSSIAHSGDPLLKVLVLLLLCPVNCHPDLSKHKVSVIAGQCFPVAALLRPTEPHVPSSLPSQSPLPTFVFTYSCKALLHVPLTETYVRISCASLGMCVFSNLENSSWMTSSRILCCRGTNVVGVSSPGPGQSL